MEYVCNNNVVIDKNVILNIENICYDKFKEKWYNDLNFDFWNKKKKRSPTRSKHSTFLFKCKL
jgi:hypothetical protein